MTNTTPANISAISTTNLNEEAAILSTIVSGYYGLEEPTATLWEAVIHPALVRLSDIGEEFDRRHTEREEAAYEALQNA